MGYQRAQQRPQQASHSGQGRNDTASAPLPALDTDQAGRKVLGYLMLD